MNSRRIKIQASIDNNDQRGSIKLQQWRMSLLTSSGNKNVLGVGNALYVYDEEEEGETLERISMGRAEEEEQIINYVTGCELKDRAICLIVGEGGLVRLVDLASSSSLDLENGNESTWGADVVVLPGNLLLIAVSDNSHTIRLYRVPYFPAQTNFFGSTSTHAKVEQIFELTGHHNNIPSVKISSCGKFLVSVSIDQSVRLWSLSVLPSDEVSGSLLKGFSNQPIASIREGIRFFMGVGGKGWGWSCLFIEKILEEEDTEEEEEVFMWSAASLAKRKEDEDDKDDDEKSGTSLNSSSSSSDKLLQGQPERENKKGKDEVLEEEMEERNDCIDMLQGKMQREFEDSQEESNSTDSANNDSGSFEQEEEEAEEGDSNSMHFTEESDDSLSSRPSDHSSPVAYNAPSSIIHDFLPFSSAGSLPLLLLVGFEKTLILYSYQQEGRKSSFLCSVSPLVPPTESQRNHFHYRLSFLKYLAELSVIVVGSQLSGFVWIYYLFRRLRKGGENGEEEVVMKCLGTLDFRSSVEVEGEEEGDDQLFGISTEKVAILQEVWYWLRVWGPRGMKKFRIFR